MRIGQFCDTFLPVVDGVGRVVYNYADGLGRRGNEVYVVTPLVDFGCRANYPFDILDFTGMSVPGSPQYRQGLPIADMHYLRRMESVEFDLIHAHSPFMAGQEAARLAKKMNVPLVGTFHSKYYDDFYKATGLHAAAEVGTLAVVEFFRRCDQVWTVSNNSAEVLNDYGYKGKIEIVENGTKIVEPDQTAAEEISATLNLGSAPVALYVGQLNWKKNLRTVLEACALLRSRGAEFKLVLAGQGPDREEIQSVAEKLGIADMTVFAGHITDSRLLNGLYLRSALFVFLSLYDTAGLVVREAAVMGTPSLAVRGGAAAETITDGENGLLCDNSAQSACDAMAKVLFFPDELGRLGENARRTIPIGWDCVIDDVENRYSQLVNSRSPAKKRLGLFPKRKA